MRTRVIGATAPLVVEDWIDVEQIAEVEVTSEDPDHRVECAFNLLLKRHPAGVLAAGATKRSGSVSIDRNG